MFEALFTTAADKKAIEMAGDAPAWGPQLGQIDERVVAGISELVLIVFP